MTRSRLRLPQDAPTRNRTGSEGERALRTVVPIDREPRRAITPTTRPRKRMEAAVYSVQQVADLLGLSLNSTYNLVRCGEIPAKQLGSRWVVPKARFHAWLDDDQADAA